MIINWRLKKIVEILLDSRNVLTGEQLCNALGVSSRTIRSDVRQLNEILEKKGAIINSEKARGYKIEVLDYIKFKEFLKFIREKDTQNNLTAEGRAEAIIINLLINDIKSIEGITQLEREDELIIEILLAINSIFNIDFIKDNTLIDFLGPHLKASINRAKYGINIENSMLGLIKNNYPFALELAVLANNIIKNYEGFNLSEDDIGFIALHFAAALERIKYKEKSKIKDVVVVCTTGVGTSLLIKVKLESYFKNRLRVIDTISSYEFNQDILLKTDLVISTVPLQIESKKVIHIKSLIDNKEIKLIEESLDNGILFQDSLANIFKKSLFFTDVEVSDQKSILNFLTDQLLENDYINKSVKKEVFEREQLASTEIGNLVAIPHVMSGDIRESFISVVILKKGITWSKEQVQLILFIGVSNKDKNQWKSYLEKLYKNIIETEVVQRIIKCTSFDELKKIVAKF